MQTPGLTSTNSASSSSIRLNGCCDAWMGPRFRSRRECSTRFCTWFEHHDAVLDKERIMEAVWPDSIVEENNLAQAISKLRQVFGETPGSHSYIVTIPGRGYRFVAEVNERPSTAVTVESQNPQSQLRSRCSRHGCHSQKSRDSPIRPIRRFRRSAKAASPRLAGYG